MKLLKHFGKIIKHRSKVATHLRGGELKLLHSYPKRGGNISELKRQLAGMAIHKPKRRIKF
jgi:hypothetical protein